MREYNFDGLVGPTHNYAGLSVGNVASQSHAGQPANPRRAALQGLGKLRFVAGLGVGQAVLPPQDRPSLRALRQLGFSGSDEEVLAKAGGFLADGGAGDQLLRLCSSAAAMWAANAATVAPSSDTADGRLHLVPANLSAMFHRSLEAETTTRVLRSIFANAKHFVVHDALPAGGQFGDEGAANHTRLFTSTAREAVHLFAWGRRAFAGPGSPAISAPTMYPARQTYESSQALARLLAVKPSAAIFPQQHPLGIDAGAFHTDVLAVGSGRVLLLHELAFAEPCALLAKLQAQLGESFCPVFASESELPAAHAVAAYPFNSQLLILAEDNYCVVAPEESREDAYARRFFERVVADPGNPIQAVHYLRLSDSMQNGGGPACLRQRISMTDAERAAVTARVFADDALSNELEAWVGKHYRDRLDANDLRDVKLHREVLTALDELTQILRLGAVYDFQTVT